MADFTKYKREDFLANESFVNYLLQKNFVDTELWQSWISENPECHEIKEARSLFFLLKGHESLSHKSGNDVEIEKQYSKFQSLLKENNLEKEADIISFSTGKKIDEKSTIKTIILRLAGVAAILILAVSLLNYFGSNNPDSPFIVFAKTDSSAKTVTLPDGSIVQLNNYSSVEIPENYNNKKREVILTGSAFFKVYKNHSKPFIVTSGRIKTTALGTAFYIYNLHPETISISLLEGSVKIEGDKNYVLLSPGEKAVYDSNQLIFKDAFNKEQLQKFTNGNIQFEHANLLEITTILAEYFNKEVLVNGKPPKINFTGNFGVQKIETILDALQFTYGLKYKLEAQKLIISFN